MAGLKHRNIVRIIGVCQSKGESIMLVLELASLGPLHKYLHSHQYVHCLVLFMFASIYTRMHPDTHVLKHMCRNMFMIDAYTHLLIYIYIH